MSIRSQSIFRNHLLAISSNFSNQSLIIKALIRNVHIGICVCAVYICFFASANLYYWREYLCFLLNPFGVRPLDLQVQVEKFSFSILNTTPIHLSPRILRMTGVGQTPVLQSQCVLSKFSTLCNSVFSPRLLWKNFPAHFLMCIQPRFREDGFGKLCPPSPIPDLRKSVPCSSLFFSSGSPLYGQFLAFLP